MIELYKLALKYLGVVMKRLAHLVTILLSILIISLFISCNVLTSTNTNQNFSRIIFISQADPISSELFGFDMSYGSQISFPKGGKLSATNLEIDSDFILTPGTYTISEYVPTGWQLVIDINDPSGDSFSSGSQATINLAAGETVSVNYMNTKSSVTSTTPTHATSVLSY